MKKSKHCLGIKLKNEQKVSHGLIIWYFFIYRLRHNSHIASLYMYSYIYLHYSVKVFSESREVGLMFLFYFSALDRLIGLPLSQYHGLFVWSFCKEKRDHSQRAETERGIFKEGAREIKYQILVLRGKKVVLKWLITINSQPKSGSEIWRYTLIVLALYCHQGMHSLKVKGANWGFSTSGFDFCYENPHNPNENLKKIQWKPLSRNN